MLFEGRVVLSPAQRGPGGERVNQSWSTDFTTATFSKMALFDS